MKTKLPKKSGRKETAAQCRAHRDKTNMAPFVLTKTWQEISEESAVLAYSTQWLACPVCGRPIE
jgi:hypothetical protein